MSQAIKNFQIIESVEAVEGSYHVGVVLVAVEKNSERPFLARKLRLRVGSLFNDAAVFIQHSFDLATSNVQEANLDGQIDSILEFPLVLAHQAYLLSVQTHRAINIVERQC